jgi:hypothetical protein
VINCGSDELEWTDDVRTLLKQAILVKTKILEKIVYLVFLHIFGNNFDDFSYFLCGFWAFLIKLAQFNFKNCALCNLWVVIYI